ncbi:Protein CrcB homolog [uncultured delta proteobacterium]|uniref:Fluoride-specific ion channel FluC n=1 Tax=uncultured delta proteobacterium TaxID=34034 RepID=A0A212KDM5_9DELT|nr:Protein CrcB homolog [uncultured delta proteobacterium]
MLQNILCISAGASIGAVMRWLLGLAFNAVLPLLPLGTLIANLTGGYLIGVMLGVVAFFPQFPDGARLFVITGFLGALTTFSTFSGEVVLLIQGRHIVAAVFLVGLHVLGSLAMTGLGIATVTLFARGH